MKKFLRFLGFVDDDAGDYRVKRRGYPKPRDGVRGSVYDEDDEYERPPLKNGLVFFQGLPADDDKLQLREALLDGCIIVLDIRGIPSEKLSDVKDFVRFMEGVSFANSGEVLKLATSLYCVTPQPGSIQYMTGAYANIANKKQGDES